MTAPSPAAPVIPSSPGSANGLRSTPWRTAPDKPSPPPTSSPSSVRGRRICVRMSPVRQRERAIADEQGKHGQRGEQQRQQTDHRASSAAAWEVNGPAQTVRAGGIARRRNPASAGCSSNVVASEGNSGVACTTSRSGLCRSSDLTAHLPSVRGVDQTDRVQQRRPSVCRVPRSVRAAPRLSARTGWSGCGSASRVASMAASNASPRCDTPRALASVRVC